jgi:hypothetical protein
VIEGGADSQFKGGEIACGSWQNLGRSESNWKWGFSLDFSLS